MQNTQEFHNKDTWKKAISETLKKCGFIDEKFIGKIVIQVNQGGVKDLEKTERFN